jgi:anti-sigma B factor antagonist
MENDSSLLTVSGELTSLTVEKLGSEMKAALEDVNVNKLIFDLKNLEYMSSAGLRVILETKKMIDDRKGSLVIRNVTDEIMYIFEITGFSDILNFE